MFSLDNFPQNNQLWYYNTCIGAFWLLPTPSRKILWGIDDRTLGLSISAPLALDFIRRQKTSHPDWDRLSPCPLIPGLDQWTVARGNGPFTYRYITSERHAAAGRSISAYGPEQTGAAKRSEATQYG